MHAKPEKVRVRRLKRQLKAALSIGVALCAGVFLACQKTTPEARSASEGDANATPDRATPEAAGPADPAEASSSSPNDAALAVVDARADALVRATGGGPRDAAVDRREHRKGMPVPDNLLE